MLCHEQALCVQVEAVQARVAKLVPPDEPQGAVYAATVDSFQVS